MNFAPGDVFVVATLPRKNSKGLILFIEDTMEATRVRRGEQLIYVGPHETGDLLFLVGGLLIRAPYDIFKHIITYAQWAYKQQVLAVLNARK